eukprot:1158228-Pelagomonas_calceolata.AAC.1
MIFGVEVVPKWSFGPFWGNLRPGEMVAMLKSEKGTQGRCQILFCTHHTQHPPHRAGKGSLGTQPPMLVGDINDTVFTHTYTQAHTVSAASVFRSARCAAATGTAQLAGHEELLRSSQPNVARLRVEVKHAEGQKVAAGAADAGYGQLRPWPCTNNAFKCDSLQEAIKLKTSVSLHALHCWPSNDMQTFCSTSLAFINGNCPPFLLPFTHTPV